MVAWGYIIIISVACFGLIHPCLTLASGAEINRKGGENAEKEKRKEE